MLAALGAAKGGRTDGGRVRRSGTQRRATGFERDLGGRLRAERQRAQDWRWRLVGVDTCPVGNAIQDRKIRGIIG